MRNKTIAVGASLLVMALAFVARVDTVRPSGAAIDIGTPIQRLHDREGGAARTVTEQVTYDDRDIEVVAVYPVVDGALVGAEEAAARDRAVWAAAERVLPREAIDSIRQLNVITDGPDGTLAMVHRSGVAADGWILSIDVAEPTEVLEPTLVHEYGHMLTLRRADLIASSSSCDGVRIEIGCARDGFVLADWAEAFWSGVAEPAHFDADRFVTEYAASSVHEDIAETFLEYVMSAGTPQPPVIAEKVAFLAARSEFVIARAEIRAALGLR